MSTLKKHQSGFTLIEMLVVAPIVILAIGAFLSVIINMTGEVLASRASNNLSYNVQDALNRIEQDVKLSSGFLAANSVLGTNQGINDDATGFTNNDPTNGPSLILNMIATTTNPISANSGYIYLKDQPNPCASAQGINTPFVYNVVYFLKTDSTSGITTLYRRTIMPTNYNDTSGTVCAKPWQQPSCSPSYMDAQSGSVFCKTKDIALVSGVTASNLSIQYYNSEDATTANTAATNAALATDRNVALKSATTVTVTINAKQTAAGRSVERAAALRVSRLDTNASSIGTIAPTTAPAAPTLSGVTTEPTNVYFSWPRSTSATGYTFEYQLNSTSGAWTTGFTNQATLNYTVTNATHKDVVYGRVTAIGPGGSSSYGTANVTIPLWTPLTFANGWLDYQPPFASAAYTKTSSGLIVLKGLVRAGSGTIGILPPGYRPALRIMFQNATNSTGGRLDIDAAGQVSMQVGSNAWFSLDGVAFMPSGTAFTGAAFESGWVNYNPSSGNTDWTMAGYMTDSAGRVQTQGLIRAGTTTSGTVMFRLPVGSRPAEYMHVLNDANNGSSHFSIDGGGAILAKAGTSATYTSLQSMFYPASRVIGTSCTTQWCALPMQNGWKAYSAPTYSTPSYTKSSDGLVMLKGLLNGGSSAGAQVALLPAGYCPAEQLLFATISADAWARVDITRNANGTCNVIPGAGVSLTWLSLDSIRYMAE